MITIDGSAGEGGGQVLRSSLTLSMVTGEPFTIRKIRRKRRRPGLMRQHLTAVEAAREVCGAEVRGAEIGSGELVFKPGTVRPGTYRFAVGTAGSAMLVLQTLLPALALAPGATRLRLEGGTHNPMAPPFDYLERVFLPLFQRMGPKVEMRLERAGFYPAGGGAVDVHIEPTQEPTQELTPLEIFDGGRVLRRSARILVSRLPDHVAERELKVLKKETSWPDDAYTIEEVASPGPGNAVLLEEEREHVRELVAAFGEVGLRAEMVAKRAVRELRRYQRADVPVGEHLADQLLLPLALAGGGGFETGPLSGHSRTQIELIPRFLDGVLFEVQELESRDDGAVRVRVTRSRIM